VIYLDISDFNITIVGLGLIGGSYAMALRALSPKNIWAIDINKETLKKAEERGIIDKGYIDEKIPLKESDLVIICLYPDLIVEFIRDNQENFKKDAIITDTSGIKGDIVNNVNSFISENIDFISGHPMAGNENKGLDYASKDLFKNTNYIITPNKKNKEENIEVIITLAKKMGCRNVVKIDPERHDEIIALTSHLTHVLAVTLVNSNILDIDTRLFIGGSFRDASRVALINSELWSQLLISNKKHVVSQIEIFENNLKFIKNAIMNDDINYLQDKFNEASCKRRELI
jgi:prephenate dehydrogenase